jgi:hypothetical protein
VKIFQTYNYKYDLVLRIFRFVFWVFGAWTFYALILSPAGYFTGGAFMSEPFHITLLRDLGFSWWSALFTFLTFPIVKHSPLAGRQWWRRVPDYVLLFGAYWLWFLAYDTVAPALFPSLFGTIPAAYAQWYVKAFSLLSTYTTMVAAVHAVVLANFYRERGNRLAEARLALLRQQLNPHFLFNALNAIAELGYTSPEKADGALQGLSELLRRSLETGTKYEISLGEELAFLNRYIDIQRVLLEDKLHVTMCIQPDILKARVPSMIFQPLVENAIVHGATPTEGVWVEVGASKVNGQLMVEISDKGPGLNSGAGILENNRHSIDLLPVNGNAGRKDHQSIGLANTRARLARLYGREASVALANNAHGGVTVRMAFPFHEAYAYAEDSDITC